MRTSDTLIVALPCAGCKGAMSDPDFWRNLAQQFRDLDPYGVLRADLDYIVGSGDFDHWRIVGDHSLTARFMALARRAGRAIYPTGPRDPLFVWLNALRRSPGPYLRYGVEIREKNADGSDGIRHLMHTIDRVCVASADYCCELESEGLKSARRPTPPPEQIAPVEAPVQLEIHEAESTGQQIARLRGECRFTIEQLAEKVEVNIRTVQRHLVDETVPHDRHITAYERVFSKCLNRKIVIKKMP